MKRPSLFTHLHRSVVPSKGNDHHPHLLRREVVVAVLAFAVFVEAFMLTDGFLFLRDSKNLASVLPGVVAALTNDARKEEALPVLIPNPILAKGAQLKAQDMAEKEYFSHTGPDGSLPWKWFAAAGYEYEYAGENLAVNFTDSDEVVDAWLESPTHRANIMKASFTEIGIGMATGTYKGRETVFVVQFFGKPKSAGSARLAQGQSAAHVPADQMLLSGEVLGTSTVSAVERFLASPVSLAKQIFYGLAALFALIILLGIIFARRLPRFSALIAGLLVIALMLGLVITNKQYFLGEVTVDEGSASDSR